MKTNQPSGQTAMSNVTIQKLTIYDKDGALIWDGLFDSPVPAFGVGTVFWIGTYSDRKWYKIQRATTGLDTISNMLVTEIAVVAHSASSDARDEPDTNSELEAKKKVPTEKKRATPDRVVEDCKQLLVRAFRQEMWRNKKGNITLRFDYFNTDEDYRKLSVQKIEETSDGPDYQTHAIYKPEPGSETSFSTSLGRIRIIVTDALGSVNLRVLEYEKAVTL